MYSMTGYGKATVSLDGRELTVELKSVNHRFLDINTKIPRTFVALEDIIRNGIGNGIQRGHIDVFVNYINNSQCDKEVTVDMPLAQSYVTVAQNLANQFGMDNNFNLINLMKCPEVVKLQQSADDEQILRQMLADAVSQAVINLNAMRQTEGQKLHKDILNRLKTVEKLVNQIEQYAPTVVENYRTKLTQRITEALQSVELDQSKLINEVAFFADKSNIDEEITRLHSHIVAAKDILKSTQPVGRKLDFLVQEFNREANTVCSKSNDINLTNIALQLKNEIEKIREQVQNLE